MDRVQFDILARLVSTQQSRRGALAVVLGAALLGHMPTPLPAKGHHEGKGKVYDQAKAKATATSCYPGARCTPGKGKNTSGCDFSNSTLFRNTDVRGANLSNSTFRGADLAGADFRGANVSGSCFVGANLRDAKLGTSVNLGGTVFCRTTMPDGSINDRDCGKTTDCCPHLLQDCPDAYFDCWIVDRGSGECDVTVGRLGPVGTCWTFPVCCPCEHHDDNAYWAAQCEQSFPECAGRCQAEFEGENGCHEGFICP